MSLPGALPYMGTFKHSFDEKGRLTVPREWRGEGFEERLVVLPAAGTQGKMLRVFPGSYLTKEFTKLGDADLDDPRRVQLERLFSAGQMLQADAQNRVGLKDELREWAGLEKAAVLIGAGDHFQICTPAAYAARGGEMPTIEQVLRGVRG